MDQWVKALDIQHDDQFSVPGSYIVEGNNSLPKFVL